MSRIFVCFACVIQLKQISEFSVVFLSNILSKTVFSMHEEKAVDDFSWNHQMSFKGVYLKHLTVG